jgi:hypothetical protein
VVNRPIRHITGLLLLFAGLACNEEFSPKTEFEERIVVYAIASSNQGSATVSAIVMRSFDLDGVNPAGATVDPTIRGATVIATARGVSTTLRETRKPGVDSLTGIGPRWYYIGSLGAYPGELISLTVDLPDGRRLAAQTQLPPSRYLQTTPEFPPTGVFTADDPYHFGTAWIFDWESSAGDQVLFFPSLHLIYDRRGDSGFVSYSREVPLRMVSQGGTMVGEYPGATTASRAEFEFAAIDEIMRVISEGDPEKNRYVIIGLNWEFLEYDFALSRYYSTVNGYLDAYSVRLDETVYSNVSGGVGVFGSRLGYSLLYTVDANYAGRFGYITGKSGD